MKKLTTFIASTLLLGSTTLLSANIGTTNARTDALSNGKAIASVTVLTPLENVKTSGDLSTVKIKGFRLESYPQMVVRDMKRGELYIEFPEEAEELALKSFKVIKEYEDDYGEIWHEVEGEFTLKASTVTVDSSDLKTKAKKTYEQTCSMCHRLHAPKDFTVNQWPHQVESMMTEIPLELPVKELIVKYLQHNAADAK